MRPGGGPEGIRGRAVGRISIADLVDRSILIR